jgi:hypothetical protein
VITEPTRTDGDTGTNDDTWQDRPQVEQAVLHRLRERGLAVSVGEVRREIDRSLARFRDVRVHQYVPIFVIREACALLERTRRAAGPA